MKTNIPMTLLFVVALLAACGPQEPQQSPDQVAVRAASRGELYLSPAISTPTVDDLLALRSESQDSEPLDLLTAREREVLQLVAEGHTNLAIGQEMHISVKTVEKHRASLMAKLDAHDVAVLVRFAVKHKLIFLDE
jgi:DNA-binding NarL/FixJ family response regulator